MNRENRIRWQADLVRCAGQKPDPKCELVTEIDLGDSHFASMKEAVRRYLCACLECDPETTSEQTLNEDLNSRLHDIPNRTPNGALVPKQEFQSEYNAIHRAVADWMRALNIAPLMRSVRCPIVIRAVDGKPNPASDQRPYAASKMHVDLWAGDPPDSVSIIIPMLGDLKNTTIEWYRPPEGFEEKYLRVMENYDVDGSVAAQSQLYPLTARMGFAYFVDAVVMHRTVQHGGGTRVNLQFDIRRPLPDTEVRKIHSSFKTGRLGIYMDPELWLANGTTSFLKFLDTNADAKGGVFRQHQDDQRTYEIVESLAEKGLTQA